MAGGYEHKQGGTEGVAALLHGQQQQLNALRSGAGIKSSIIRGVRLLFQDDNGATIGKFGTFSVNYVDAGGDMTGGTAQGSLYQNPATGRFLFIASANPVDGVTNVQAGDAGNWDALAAFRAYCTNTNIWASGTAHIHGGDGAPTDFPRVQRHHRAHHDRLSGERLPRRLHWTHLPLHVVTAAEDGHRGR